MQWKSILLPKLRWEIFRKAPLSKFLAIISIWFICSQPLKLTTQFITLISLWASYLAFCWLTNRFLFCILTTERFVSNSASLVGTCYQCTVRLPGRHTTTQGHPQHGGRSQDFPRHWYTLFIVHRVANDFLYGFCLIVSAHILDDYRPIM